MSINTINADTFKKMFLAGAKNLEFNKEWINELNVFPVPDGDTGTNMTLTIMSAANEVNAIKKPDIIPGFIWGSITFLSAYIGVAPKSIAASSIF